jgi:hypothetical protein
MTNEELRAACEAVIAAEKDATPGPWSTFEFTPFYEIVGPDGKLVNRHLRSFDEDDAKFIVAARTIAPAVARACLELLERAEEPEKAAKDPYGEALRRLAAWIDEGNCRRLVWDVFRIRENDGQLRYGVTLLSIGKGEDVLWRSHGGSLADAINAALDQVEEVADGE